MENNFLLILKKRLSELKGLTFAQKKNKLTKIFLYLKTKNFNSSDMTEEMVNLIVSSLMKDNKQSSYKEHLTNIIVHNLLMIIDVLKSQDDTKSTTKQPKLEPKYDQEFLEIIQKDNERYGR